MTTTRGVLIAMSIAGLCICAVAAQTITKRFLRVDIDMEIIDPIRVYEVAHEMLVARYGLTDVQAMDLLKPDGVLDLEVCVERLVLDRLGVEANGLFFRTMTIDRNSVRATLPPEVEEPPPEAAKQ